MTLSRRTLAGVPVLLAAPAPSDSPPPVALWFHGFRAASDAHERELARVAALGYLAVGVDAVGHGARAVDDMEARMAAHGGRGLPVMLGMADATARELPALLDAIGEARLGDPRRVAAVGISMGGFLAYRAPLADARIRTVVALLGDPVWPGFEASPHAHVAALAEVALLSITAERDVNVPPANARRLHEVLASVHGSPDRHRHLELAGAEHLMSAEHWQQAIDATLGWLARHRP